MERQQIRDLLEKYFAGETELREEQQLRTYFKNTTQLPEEWEGYRLLFGSYEEERAVSYPREVLLPAPRSYKWVGVVASFAAVLLVLLILQPFADNGQSSSEAPSAEATQNARSLFMIMGNAPREGKENLEYLNELNALQIGGSARKKKEVDSVKTEKQTIKNKKK